MKISFCTTCQNYTHYLKQVYVDNLKIGSKYDCEFILVNYNSTDDMDEWVKDNLQDYIDSGSLIYHKNDILKGFNMSVSKNLSHRLATGDVLVNLDADNILTKEFIDWLIETFTNFPNTITQGRGHGCGGRVALWKNDFDKLGGYDESLNRPSSGTDHFNLCLLANIKLGRDTIYVLDHLCPYLEQDKTDKDKALKRTKDMEDYEFSN